MRSAFCNRIVPKGRIFREVGTLFAPCKAWARPVEGSPSDNKRQEVGC